MKKYLPLAIALAVSAPTLACAQESTQQMMTPEHFSRLDTDNNGAVSRKEYQQFMESAFVQLDANSDGSLDKAEGTKVLSPEQFDGVDTDKNGGLSHDEFMTQVLKDFDDNDHDGDGELRQP